MQTMTQLEKSKKRLYDGQVKLQAPNDVPVSQHFFLAFVGVL
jgi:hypothetical protein